MKNEKNNTAAHTATRSTSAFMKGRRRAEAIMFPKGDKAPSWRQRCKSLIALVESAGEQQRRGVAELLFGSSFAIIQIRDERVWRQLLDQLDASLGVDELLRAHLVRSLVEAKGPEAKLAVVDTWDKTLLTERQAQALRSRYGAKATEGQVAKALVTVRFAPQADRRRRGAKTSPYPMGKVWSDLCDILPGVEVADIDRALERVARGDQAKRLPARTAQLVAFRREAKAKRRPELKNLAK